MQIILVKSKNFLCKISKYIELLKYNTPISCICQVFIDNIVYIVAYLVVYFGLTFEIIVI